MPKSKHYRRLTGDSAYYPYGARKKLRSHRKKQALLLRFFGILLLCLAAALVLRQTIFNGGQPAAPAAVATAAPTAAAAPDSATIPQSVAIKPATIDALAATSEADTAAHATPQPQPQADTALAAEVLPLYHDLYAQNADMVGWLRIDGTEINYPVMQAADNKYYLRRGFDRLYAVAGSLFLDARCSLHTPTANWLVYGHNMADGSMFGGLLNYEQPEFYAAHPTFSFDTLTTQAQWQVVAVLRTNLSADALPYYTFFDAADAVEWQQRVDAITAMALYDTGVTPHYGQQLLTLSTCGSTAAGTTSRFAVLAVRVDETTNNSNN